MDFNNITNLQEYITHTQIWGVIPLDIVSHFVIGAMITIILLKLKVSFKKTLIILFNLAFIKEVTDGFRSVDFSLFEAVKDIIITCLYQIIIGAVRFIKSRST